MKLLFCAIRCLLAILSFCICEDAAAENGKTWPKLSLGNVAKVWYDYSKDKCAGDDWPDVAARAFRMKDATIALVASHYTTRMSYIDAFGNFKHSCPVVLRSNEDANPAAFNDKVWISSTWKMADGRIIALLHDEYQAHHHPGKCIFSTYLACWYNSVVLATSSDEGRHFEVGNGDQVVAAAPFLQSVGQGKNRGFFGPSNIIKDDGSYKSFFFWSGAVPGTKTGSCLFSTRKIDDPAGWRAYKTGSFSVSFKDPYRNKTDEHSTCDVLLPESVSSFVRLRDGRYMAFYQHSDPTLPTAEIDYVFSSNLTNWTVPRRLVSLPSQGSKNCDDDFRYSYPSVIDLSSHDPNFEDVGSDAFLFLTRYKVRDCKVSEVRDLISFRLSISNGGVR